VGQALAPLAEQGFLIVASGNITHNLRDWQIISMTGQPTPDYVQQFADWIHTQMTGHHTDALLNYRQTQPAGTRAHPRDEHLLPLFTALGAAGADAQPEAFYRGIYDHVIAMDGYVFH
jgi:4,5-DOPA dioxygenase extradiol